MVNKMHRISVLKVGDMFNGVTVGCRLLEQTLAMVQERIIVDGVMYVYSRVSAIEDIEDICGAIDNARIDGDAIVVDFKIFDTDKGKLFKHLYDNKIIDYYPIRISYIGTVVEGNLNPSIVKFYMSTNIAHEKEGDYAIW